MIRTFGMTLMSATLLVAPVYAQSAAVTGQSQATLELAQARNSADVVAQLEAQGYIITAMRQTLLGRIQIEARTDTTEREIIMSRATGEILSDQVRLRHGTAATVVLPERAAPAEPGGTRRGLGLELGVTGGADVGIGGGGFGVGGSGEVGGGVGLGIGRP